MGRFEDLTGQKFGRLTVIGRAENKGSQTYWKCKCDCGNECTVNAYCLKKGFTKSCCCFRKDFLIVHGMYDTKIYKTWENINSRCNNPNTPEYPNYGGRGIRICDEWKNFQDFYNYVSKLPHFGEEGYSLDRIDNNGNYAPNNVRWADIKTQQRNKRTNLLVEYNGAEMILKDAAKLSGISYATLLHRYSKGETGEKLFRPVKKRK